MDHININKATPREERCRSGTAGLHSQRVTVGFEKVGLDDPGRELRRPLPGDDDAEADHRASVAEESYSESEEGTVCFFQETGGAVLSGRVDLCETRGRR